MQWTSSFSSAGSGGTSQTGGTSDWTSAAGSEQSAQVAGESHEDNPAAELASGSQGGLQEAVHGVLYTLSKEKFTEGWKFVVITMVIDFLQLAVFFIGTNFVKFWTLDQHKWYWKWLSWICFTNMFQPTYGLGNGNYTFYLVIFFVLATVLVVSFALCVFVAHCFRTNNFYMWPIRVLKVAVSFFFEVFYISTLGIFSVSLDCTYYKPTRISEKFPTVECFQTPHVIIIAISISISLLAMGMAYCLANANSELNPACRELTAQANHRSALLRMALISLVTLVQEILPSYSRIQAAANIIIIFYLCYRYVRYVPFQTAWVNGLQASFFASLTWASFLLCIMAYVLPGVSETMTIVLWAGILPVVAAVWCLLYYRMHHAHKVALKYRAGLKSGTPVIHRFFDADEVEVVARCARIRDQWGELQPVWVDTAEAVIKAGLEQFPKSAFLHIFYSSFLIEHRKVQQTAGTLLEAARKLQPSLGERFMIFVRDREAKQKAGAAGGAGYDLLSYVEQQNAYRALVDGHVGTLRATRDFWRQLVRKDVLFMDLTRAFAALEASERRAEATFKSILERYPTNTRFLRSYARYLEDCKSNPWVAARYNAEADRIDAEVVQAAQEASLEGGAMGAAGDRPIVAMAEDGEATVIISETGVIQFVNKQLCELFGHTAPALTGKNVSVLMPPHVGQGHGRHLMRFKKDPNMDRLAVPRHLIALHKEGYCFRMTLGLRALQHAGQARCFAGVVRPVETDRSEAYVWTTPQGAIVGLDEGFCNMFGYRMADVEGLGIGALCADAAMTKIFEEIVEKAKGAEFINIGDPAVQHTFSVNAKHRYGAAVAVNGQAMFVGSEAMKLVALKFDVDEKVARLGLVAFNPAGQVVFANNAFELGILGYTVPGQFMAKAQGITDLMRPPFGTLHLRWMQAALRGQEAPAVHRTGCRTGRTVVLLGRNNHEVPVRLTTSVCLMGRSRWLTATVERVEVPPASAWGSGELKDLLANSKRLQLLVQATDGKVVAHQADAAALAQVFGQNAAKLPGRTLQELVPDFSRPADYAGTWPSVAQLLSQLAAHSAAVAAGGGAARASFRVGLRADAAVMGLRACMLGPASTIPCCMVVLPLGDTDVDVLALFEEGLITEADIAAAASLHVVQLHAEALLEAVVELRQDFKLHASSAETDFALLFGRPVGKQQSVLSVLAPAGSLPPGARVEDLLAPGAKKSGGQLKKSGGDSAVLDKQVMVGTHADGSTMVVEVQGVDKHGDGSRWLLRVVMQDPQPQTLGRPNLVRALAAHQRTRVAKVASPASSRSITPPPGEGEEFQISTKVAPAGKAATEAEGSERGDDATSMNDGASVADSSGRVASDYARAKRYRKLNRMLSSPKARAMINALKKCTLWMIATMLIVHVVFFSIVQMGGLAFKGVLSATVESGKLGNGISKAIFGSRVIASTQDYNNPFSMYADDPAAAPAVVAHYSAWLEVRASNMAGYLLSIFTGDNPKKQVAPVTPGINVLFTSPVINTKHWVQTLVDPFRETVNASYLDLGLRMATAIRLVAHPPAGWGDSLGNYTDYLYIQENGPTSFVSSMLACLDLAEERAHITLGKQIVNVGVFMAVEAGLVIPLCCIAFLVLLKLVNDARVNLFNVFLVVPRPVVMQLASKDVSLYDGGDDEADRHDDDDAWARQQAAEAERDGASAHGPKKALGLSLQVSTGRRRKLRNSVLTSYRMLLPFVVWDAIVLVVFGVVMALLQRSVKPVGERWGDSPIAGHKLHFFMLRILANSAKLAVAPDAASITAAKQVVLDSVASLEEWQQALLFGNEELGLDGAITKSKVHEDLWYGTGCLRVNHSSCYAPSHPYYPDTNNGLANLLNQYAQAALAFAKDSFENQNLYSSYYRFILAVGQDGGDLGDGMQTNTDNFVHDGEKRMQLVTVIQVLGLVAGVLGCVFWWSKMVRPFNSASKREARRVAELLSQLPRELAIEQLVLQASNQSDDKDEEEEERRAVEAARTAAAGGRWLARIRGGGAGRVVPAPGGGNDGDGALSSPRKVPAGAGGGGREGGSLRIVVSKNTSKDQEAGGGQMQTKYQGYHETLHRHQTNQSDAQDDPELWAGHSPRKVSFRFPNAS